MNGLTFEGMFKDGFSIGIKNITAVIVNMLLWVLTVWIPYLNIGTTIGLISMVAKMGRADGLKMTEIFNPSYRKYMGEFFLVYGFMMSGIFMGFIFLVIPGIVIGIAWSLSPLLVLDKGLDPVAAIKKSNDLTYGKKWLIFLGKLAVSMVMIIAVAIIGSLLSIISMPLGAIAGFIGFLLFFAITMGVDAYIYRELTAGI